MNRSQRVLGAVASRAAIELDTGPRLVPLFRRPYRCELLTRS